MDIGVEGDRNRVAGRDYQEGNTHLQLNIHGNNYAPISLGAGGSGGGGDELRPIHLWTAEELRASLADYRAQWWSGFRGYWFNIPCLALFGVLLGIGSSLYAGVLPVREPQSMWMVLAPCLLAVAGLSFWLMNIRRIEGNLMAESRAAIDTIRTELRRRR